MVDYLRNWLSLGQHQEIVLFVQLSAVTTVGMMQLIYFRRLNYFSAVALILLLIRGLFFVRLPDAMGLTGLGDYFDSYFFRSPFYAFSMIMLYLGYKKMRQFHQTMEQFRASVVAYSHDKDEMDRYINVLTSEYGLTPVQENNLNEQAN